MYTSYCVYAYPFLLFFSVIRIEIDSYLADYFPEIDAVLLVGTDTYPSFEESLKLSVSGLSEKVVGLGLHRFVPGFNVIENIKRLCVIHNKSRRRSTTCYLDKLPVNTSSSASSSFFVIVLTAFLQEEILRIILAFLDLRSLCSLACASISLNRACQDPVLFTSVNLKVNKIKCLHCPLGS